MALPSSTSRQFDAVGFGLNTTDILTVVDAHPAPGTKTPIRRMETQPGGQAATAMTACSKLGWKVSYVGNFGDDVNGIEAVKRLQADGIDLQSSEVITDTRNAVSLILVEETSGQRTVMWSRDPNLRQKPKNVRAKAVTSGRVLMVDCHDTEAAIVAARYARESLTPTVIDVEYVRPGISDLLKQIDFIITSQEFPMALTGIRQPGAALRAIFDCYRPVIACATLGEEGSLAITSQGEIRTPGFSVSVVDTTGAGDCFRGGFISGWLLQDRNAELEEVLRYANAVAALKCQSLGARSAIPNRAKVMALLGKS